MNTLLGLRIIESKHIAPVPRMQVSPEFERIQSPALVASTNAWMRERFGTYHPVYVIGDGSIAMHPDRFAMLKLNMKGWL